MRQLNFAWSLIVLAAWVVPAHADVKPSNLFTDHAVLLSGASVPVWGTASPGEAVSVSIAGQTQKTVTAADGRWMVHLAQLKPGGPFEMTIAGNNQVVVKDILVGEVWLGSGQSNMQFTVSAKHASFAGMLDEDKEIAAANFPRIRMFTGKATKAYEPQAEIEGEWKVCSPDTVGDFSAVGYLFARDLQRDLNVPVGILLEAYGASTAEAWVPRQQMAADPSLKPMLERLDARESYFREHPTAIDTDAPPAPQTLNARPAKPGPLHDPAQDQHQPTVLYNAMIHPLVPYAIRGILWYQGESITNARKGFELYPLVMQTLVRQWRREWGAQLPFYVVQLAALDNVSNNPAVREAQAQILKLPNTGMAVTIDIGDEKNVHPKNKEPLGERLTLIALANVYGRQVEFSGPIYAGSTITGDTVRLKFTHAAGLTAKDGPLQQFQVAGYDQKFVDAEARVVGNVVLVRAAAVPAPVAVRYAWTNYPFGANLTNGAGLPAAPFRTDTWDVIAPLEPSFTGR